MPSLIVSEYPSLEHPLNARQAAAAVLILLSPAHRNVQDRRQISTSRLRMLQLFDQIKVPHLRIGQDLRHVI